MAKLKQGGGALSETVDPKKDHDARQAILKARIRSEEHTSELQSH